MTRNVENFEDGDFPALRSNYDRRTHAHDNKSFKIIEKFHSVEI